MKINTHPTQLLGGISVETFLRDYWQKKPLLVRQAFTLDAPPVSPEELAGLACEPEISSRLVEEHHIQGPWHLSYGPFDEDDFAKLPESHWTLLVSDCEKHLPELRLITDNFRFIPDWRIDDLMISYAANQGSVGPHTDEYDVFLLQLDGVREWQICPDVDVNDVIDGLALKILRHFEPKQSWQLQPGDMLYLPPLVAHHGIAQGECLTASIGFRAPARQDLLQSWIDEIILNSPDTRRYRDLNLQLQSHPAEITTTALTNIKKLLAESLQSNPENFNQWIGKLLTEPKLESPYKSEPAIIDFDAFVQKLHDNRKVRREEFSNLAYIQEEDKLIFFTDGLSHNLPKIYIKNVHYLCDNYLYETKTLNRDAENKWYRLLFSLYQNGIMYF